MENKRLVSKVRSQRGVGLLVVSHAQVLRDCTQFTIQASGPGVRVIKEALLLKLEDGGRKQRAYKPLGVSQLSDRGDTHAHTLCMSSWYPCMVPIFPLD